MWKAALLAGATLFGASGAAAADEIPYASRNEAQAALEGKAGVVKRSEGDWLIYEDEAEATLWLLTTSGNPLHPSFVRRRVVSRSDGIYIESEIRCGLSQAECDRLLADQ